VNALAILRQTMAGPDMRRVQGGWLLAITAEWIYLVSLLVLAYDLGGVLAVGLISMVRMLPAALLGPMVATLTDRLPRQRVLLGVHLGRAMLIALIAFSAMSGLPAVLIFTGALLEGILATLHRPTTASLLPSLARAPEELVASNATMSLSEGFAVLVGPAIGGLLLATVGAQTGLLAGAIGFGLAGLALIGVRPAQMGTAAVAATAGRARLAELFGGFATLRRQPHIGTVVLVLVSQTFVRGILTVLIVAVAVELLQIGEAGVGYLNSALGAGGLVGAVIGLTMVVRRRLAPVMLVSLALWSLPIAAIGLAPGVMVAFAALALIGVANATLDISAFTILQRIVPNAVRGRVFGAMEGAISLTIGLGSLVAPLLVALVGLEGALVITGLILPTVALVGARAVIAAEARAIVPERELALLRGVPMFAPLPLTMIEQLAGAVDPSRWPAGTAIVEQGDASDCFYIIAAGRAAVIHDGSQVAELGVGEGFGEIALLREVPRTATVRAETELEVMRLGRAEFLAAITGTDQSVEAANAVVGSRMRALGRDG
jgi:MFS family permease